MAEDNILKFLFDKRRKGDSEFYTIKEICKGIGIEDYKSNIYTQTINLNNRGFLELKSKLVCKPRLQVIKTYRLRKGHISLLCKRFAY